MSNSRRWKEFITWWRDLSTVNMDRVDLESAIDKKIREIQERTVNEHKNSLLNRHC